jgi:LysM repeat protein
MRPARQLAGGLLYALVSVVLVIGSLSLAIAEQDRSKAPSYAPTAPPSMNAQNPAVTVSPFALPESTSTPVPSITETFRSTSPTQTGTPLSTPTVRRYVPPSSTTKPLCGPLPGWTKSYEVKPGDTLFHISYLYGTTVPRLQQANCKTSTVIYPGEWLWVPSGATITPGTTVIPTFASPTDAAGVVPPTTDDNLTATALADP